MSITRQILTIMLLAVLSFSVFAANEHAVSVTGIQGYDLVSYQTGKRPVRGNGHYVSVHNGVTYMFSSKENKNVFDRHPEKYLPAYGGYCAFGVSVGKKFVGDPEVWRIVDGRLYLNLDESIQDQWLKDVPGRIRTADKNWKEIRSIPSTEL